jgi:hypothetical protein
MDFDDSKPKTFYGYIKSSFLNFFEYPLSKLKKKFKFCNQNVTDVEGNDLIIIIL